MELDHGRRRLVGGTGGAAVMALAAAAGLLRPGSVRAQHQPAWNKALFETRTLQEALKAMGGGSATPSKEIDFSGPDIAENGAVVSFTIASRIPRTEAIALLVEKNPSILVANFAIPQGTDPWVNTRAKMGQTSNVIALVKADGKFHYAAREVKVTLGGCGG